MTKYLLILGVILSLQISGSAFAFKLYETPGGLHVRWDRETVELVLDPSLAALGEMEEVRHILQQAVSLWESKGDVPVQFALVEGDCNTIENDNNNCIFACTDSESCPRDEKDKGATTLLSISPETGAIQDVDIVFNAHEWRFALDRDEDEHGAHNLDLNAVAIHELGHALGIDHSEETEAVMFPNLCTGTAARSSLHEDDIAAAQTLYEDFVPLVEAAYGCTIAGPGATDDGIFFMGLAILGAGMLIRRGRRGTY